MLQTGRMTSERFQYLLSGAGRKMTGDDTNAAAYDVLVNGFTQVEAAKAHGVSKTAVSSKVRKILQREKALIEFLGL